MSPLASQLINLLAAILLLLAFAMLSQRRVLSLVHLFTLQGAALVASTTVMAYATISRIFISPPRSHWS